MIEKKFILGDVFTVQPVKKLTIKGKAYIMDKDIISSDGKTPYIAAISSNNGITGYSNFEANNKGDCITLSTTADSSNTVFYQEDNFIGRQQIAEIRRKDGKPMGRSCGLYITAIIKKLTTQFNYSNKLTIDYLKNAIISLPVKMKYVPNYQILSTFEGGGIDMNKIDTSSWRDFKVEELFGKCKLGKYHNPDNLVKDKNGYPYICASNSNNGINKDMPRVNGINLSLTVGNIIAWGKQCPMFTYHSEPCVTGQGMYYIELPDNITENIALFICSALTAACKGKYNYGNCLIGSRMDETIIKLPVKETEEIDFEYMEERIAELEEERIAELEGYLVATGLNDYELTDEDRQVLSLSGFGHYEERDSEDAVKIRKEMREFRCGDLFDIHPTKAYKMSNDELYQTSGNSPVLSNSSVNNGIGGYCGLYTTEDGRIITFSDTTTGTDTMFYQPNPFIGYAHVQGMYPFDDNWKEFQQRYFICAMKQACGTGWDYSNKFKRKLVAEMTPLLPIQTDASNNPIIDTERKYHPDGYIPDWGFMEKYIKAIEKIVIADVVKYKDEMIETTKSVIVG